jgi:hypothetical protein
MEKEHRPLREPERDRNRTKAQVHAKVEQLFLVIQRMFGCAKVRYRGLAKKTSCSAEPKTGSPWMDEAGPCSRVERYGTVEHIDHTWTKTRHPQTNGICERFHNTRLNEFYRVVLRKKIHWTLEDLQVDLETWVPEYTDSDPVKAVRAMGRPHCKRLSTGCR